MIVVPQNGRDARANRTPDLQRAELERRRADAVRRAEFYRDQMSIEERRGDVDAVALNAQQYFRQLGVIERLDQELGL